MLGISPTPLRKATTPAVTQFFSLVVQPRILAA